MSAAEPIIRRLHTPTLYFKSRCCTCLSLNRKMFLLTEKRLITMLCPSFFTDATNDSVFMVCWECNVMILKIKEFQSKVITSQYVTLMIAQKVLGYPLTEGLSNLKMSGTETIQILPDSLPSPDLEPVEITTKCEYSSSPTNPPSIAEYLPPFPPFNDYDELIQPIAIPLIQKVYRNAKKQINFPNSDCNDPPVLEMQNNSQDENKSTITDAPAEIKTEKTIPDPEIFFRAQTPCTTIPKGTVIPRGFKEIVKVTVGDPNMVRNRNATQFLLDIGIEEIIPDFKADGMEIMPYLMDDKEDISKSRLGKSNTTGAKVKLLTRAEVMKFREKQSYRFVYHLSSYKCNDCITHFPSIDKLLEHNKKHVMVYGDYDCDICQQRFPTEILRNKHYKDHFIIFECIKCPYQTDDSTKMSAHIRRLHEVTKYFCKGCNAVLNFRTLAEKVNHIRSVHVKCSSEPALKVQQKYVQKKKKVFVECGICFKKLNKLRLKYHMETKHRPEGRNRLDSSNTVYKNKRPCKPHLVARRKYKKKEKLAVKCHHCEEFFTTKNSLKSHIYSLTGNFSCATCKQKFVSRRDFRKHVSWAHEMISKPLT